MFVKVCGLKTEEQIDWAVELGYDAIGVVTYPQSKRYCKPDLARQLAEHARSRGMQSFVVSMTYAEVEPVADAFDIIQIYEPKPLPNLAYSSKEPPPTDLDYQYFVYDASAGSGEFKSFPDWLHNIGGGLLVAGGLSPDNVSQVVQEYRPFGVDVSSGVEIEGVKDLDLMKNFINAAHNV